MASRRYRRTFRRRRRSRFSRPFSRSKVARYRRPSISRRLFRSSSFFMRLHFQLTASKGTAGTFDSGPYLKLSDFDRFSSISQNWSYCKVWKCVVKATPLSNLSSTEIVLGQHAIAPLFSDPTSLDPTATVNFNYDTIMALPHSKHTAGTNPLSLSFIPRVAPVISGLAGGVTAYGLGYRKRPIINCERGREALLPPLYGYVYSHNGIFHLSDAATKTAEFSVQWDFYAYVSFFQFNGGIFKK